MFSFLKPYEKLVRFDVWREEGLFQESQTIIRKTIRYKDENDLQNQIEKTRYKLMKEYGTNRVWERDAN